VIPIGDENPTARPPVVTYAIIALNGAAFLWFNLVRGEGFLGLSPEDVHRWGLLPGHPTPLRLVSSMFLHANLMHLLGNMWFLHIFGDNVEDKIGRGRFLALYLGWGLLASLCFLVFGKPFGALTGAARAEVEHAWQNLPLVGASGAISGVMGAYLVLFPRARVRLIWPVLFIFTFHLPAAAVIGMYFLQDLLLGLFHALGPASGYRALGGVAYAAHTGGMVAGILAGLILKPWIRRGASTAWDRDTGFVAGGDGVPDGEVAEAWAGTPRTIPTADLRDQIVGAVLDGRMDLALDLYARWVAVPGAGPLPPAVEMEIAHEIFRRGHVEAAEAAYLRYLDAHPHGGDAAEAKFRLGLIHARALGDRARARAWLVQAAAEHPDPETAAFARRELARLEGGG
jgi:hypothetical protein